MDRDKSLRIFLFGLCVAGAAVTGAPQWALAAGEDLPMRTVGYADLDLTKAAGAQTLYRRISAAAQQVCTIPGYADSRDLGLRAHQQACVDKAIDSAVRDVNSVALDSQHGKHAIQVARN